MAKSASSKWMASAAPQPANSLTSSGAPPSGGTGPSRLHRFRHRAAAVLAAMTAEERRVLDAYVAGVNRGLGDLDAVPFEYLLLRAKPEPWTAEDTVLTVFAMYVSLQEADGTDRAPAGRCPRGSRSTSGRLLVPGGHVLGCAAGRLQPAHARDAVHRIEESGSSCHPGQRGRARDLGSNAFAVGGAISSSGAAIVANDMHLGLRVPNIWYRARLVLEDGSGRPALDITGITLPGAPTIVAGSNGRIAWGFTNSYVDTSDVVVLEPVDGNPNLYRTPEGPKELSRVQERCAGPVASLKRSRLRRASGGR